MNWYHLYDLLESLEISAWICLNRRHWPGRHVAQLYDRVHQRRGHQKAIGALARHLAEATYWMVNKEGVVPRTAVEAVSVHEGVSARGS